MQNQVVRASDVCRVITRGTGIWNNRGTWVVQCARQSTQLIGEWHQEKPHGAYSLLHPQQIAVCSLQGRKASRFLHPLQLQAIFKSAEACLAGTQAARKELQEAVHWGIHTHGTLNFVSGGGGAAGPGPCMRPPPPPKHPPDPPPAAPRPPPDFFR